MNCVNDIRLEQFLQLKKEIRGSEKHLIVGIDTAKEKHNAFFGTPEVKLCPLLTLKITLLKFMLN